jgi:hypothetical protein
MNKSDIKDKLDRSGFVFTDLVTPDGRVRVTARGPRVPGGEIGRKTQVAVRRGSETLDSRRCHSNGHAASVYVDFVDEYSTADA